MPALYEAQIRTHTGSVRDHNEDAISTVLDWRGELGLTDDDLTLRGHLFAVADGMGGHAAGEVASHMAVETLFRTYYAGASPPSGGAHSAMLSDAIAAANTALIQQAQADSAQAGMGTTLVAALLHGRNLLVANVGDSRAYLFRNRQLTQITHDHSWVAEQLAAGMLSAEDAARHPNRNVITHSLGPDRDPTPDLFHLTVQPGDRLLLCTDGLSNIIPRAELSEFLASYPSDQAADILLERALERGAPDNVTLALLDFPGEDAHHRRRFWLWLLPGLALIAALIFLLRDRLPLVFPRPFSSTSPLLAPTPASISPVSPAPQPPLADAIRVGDIELAPPGQGTPHPDLAARFGGAPTANDALRRRPLPDYYVFYLFGPIAGSKQTVDGWDLAISHRNVDGSRRVYNLTLRGPWLPPAQPPRLGDMIGIVGRPIDESNIAGDIAIEPLLLFAAGSPIWVQGADLEGWLQNHQQQWVYTVYGPGGGESLGLQTPPNLAGRPIALWGGWIAPSPADPTHLLFNRIDPAPYDWQDDVYRQAAG